MAWLKIYGDERVVLFFYEVPEGVAMAAGIV